MYQPCESMNLGAPTSMSPVTPQIYATSNLSVAARMLNRPPGSSRTLTPRVPGSLGFTAATSNSVGGGGNAFAASTELGVGVRFTLSTTTTGIGTSEGSSL